GRFLEMLRVNDHQNASHARTSERGTSERDTDPYGVVTETLSKVNCADDAGDGGHEPSSTRMNGAKGWKLPAAFAMTTSSRFSVATVAVMTIAYVCIPGMLRAVATFVPSMRSATWVVDNATSTAGFPAVPLTSPMTASPTAAAAPVTCTSTDTVVP